MVFDSTQYNKQKNSSNVGPTAHAPWSGQADVLQRSIGNRATTALLQGASQRDVQKVLSRSGLCGATWLSTPGRAAESGLRWIARYEAGEHAQFGPAGKATVNGVEIDAANIVAMADFYRSPEAMQKADPAELRALNTLIDRDKQARLGVKGVTAPSNDEIEAATNGRPEGERFMDLNKSNFSHFAPPKDPAKAADSAAKGLDHKSVWEKHHRAALDQAHRNAAPKGANQTSNPDKPTQGTVPADATVTNEEQDGRGRRWACRHGTHDHPRSLRDDEHPARRAPAAARPDPQRCVGTSAPGCMLGAHRGQYPTVAGHRGPETGAEGTARRAVCA